MIFDIAQLTGHLLDFGVAKALGYDPFFQSGNVVSKDPDESCAFDVHDYAWRCEQSSPLIDTFSINTNKLPDLTWTAHIQEFGVDGFYKISHQAHGENRIQAAMRCLVLHKIGRKIEIPDDFVSDIKEFEEFKNGNEIRLTSVASIF